MKNQPLLAKINLILIWISFFGFVIMLLLKHSKEGPVECTGIGFTMAEEIIAAIITALVSIFTTVLTIIFTRNKTEKQLMEKISAQLGLSNDKTLFQFLKDNLGTSNDCSLTSQHNEIKNTISYQNQMVQKLYDTSNAEKIRQNTLKEAGYDIVHVIDTIKMMSKQLNDQNVEIEQLRKENQKLLFEMSHLKTRPERERDEGLDYEL